MAKKILLVGHCGPDSSYLRMTVKKAVEGAEIKSADDSAELHQALVDGVDLILFNRELGYGFEPDTGVETIRTLRAANSNVPMILVSNYPDAQQAALAAGAMPGFGKRELGSPKVADLLRGALTASAV